MADVKNEKKTYTIISTLSIRQKQNFLRGSGEADIPSNT